MKTRAPLLLLLLVPVAVLADVDLYRAGTRIGPVVSINCTADAGLTCVRDGGTSMGQLSCSPASTVETGCMTPGTQSIAGNKTWTGYQRITGVAHASLTACDAAHKNMLQGCTTHGAPVWCDGTANQELIGASSDEQVLSSVHIDGIPRFTLGGFTLPSTAGWTINAISGLWSAGTGTGTLRLSFLGSAGTCSCDIDCDTPAARNACSGNCTYSAGDGVLFLRSLNSATGVTACTLDPYVVGNLQVMGVAQ